MTIINDTYLSWKFEKLFFLRKVAIDHIGMVGCSPSNDSFESKAIRVRDYQMFDIRSFDEALCVIDLVYQVPNGNSVLW